MATWFTASNVTPADPNSLQEVLPENEAYTGLVTGDMCFVIVNDLNLRIYRYNAASTETEDFFLTTVIPTLNVSGTGAWEEQRTTGLMTAFQGSFANQFDALVTESGGTVSLDFEAYGSIPALGIFPDDLIAVPIQSIELTTGDDDDPQENFVYVLESDPTALDLSTSGWPDAFHIKVAYILCPSAAYVATQGVYINQNWNDGNHPNGTGHLTGIGENIRLTQSGAVYHDGVGANGATSGYITIDTGDTPDSVYFVSTSGHVYQMHKHDVPAYDTDNGSEILVVNSSVAVYNAIKDISDETDDANGDPLNNKYYNVVFMGVGNKTGEYAPLLMNLPSGSYNTEAGALRDTEGYDNYGIPAEFSRQSATGFLICRITFRNQSGNLSVIETVDLRGQTPGTASGTTAYAGTDFSDDLFTLFDADAITSILDFNLANITPGNTRTVLPVDADMTLFSTADYTDLTDGGETTLHYHDALKAGGQVGVSYVGAGAAQLNYNGVISLLTAASSILVYNSNGTAYSQYLHNGTDVSIGNSVNSGHIILTALRSAGGTSLLFTGDPDAATTLYYAGLAAMITSESGIDVQDSAGTDVRINLSNSSGTTMTEIRSNNGSFTFYDSQNSKLQLGCNVSGGVDLYHNGVLAMYATVSPGIYVVGTCSALVFTDRTPAYEGQDAISELNNISNKDGKIDHKTLPEFAQKKLIKKDGKEEDGRDLGAMISILVKAIQELSVHEAIIQDQMLLMSDRITALEGVSNKSNKDTGG
jgi:hypothetical protein